MKRAITTLILVVLSSVSFAQAGGGADDRKTIAEVARLTLGTSGDAGIESLRAAMAHASPNVRAAAARVAHVTSAVDLIGDLRASLAKEFDAETAHELAWALADLDTTSDSDEVLRLSLIHISEPTRPY